MDWFTILMRCGVSSAVAQEWAPIFAVEAAPEKFSLGHQELDDFLGQVLHESAMLTRTEEGLNYSPERLQVVWPSRFASPAAAMPYAHNPRALANYVYGGRYGNTGPDDGWLYRGGGLIQTTFRSNYRKLGAALGLPLEEKPELLRTDKTIALRSAVSWWEGNVPDEVMGDLVKVRKAVNGGTVGLEDTKRLTALADKADGMADGGLVA
jgi:putative chitinase